MSIFKTVSSFVRVRSVGTRRTGFTALALAGGALGFVLGGATCSEPTMLCTTAHGAFSVTYTLMEGTGECAQLKGGVVGIQTYVNGAGPSSVDFDKPPVAIKTDETGALVDQYGADIAAAMLSGSGTFTQDKPGADGFCSVSDLTPVNLSLPAVPAMPDGKGGMTDALPAVALKLEWSQLRFYVTPALIGVEFTGQLRYTKNGCVATYAVRGLSPSVSCAVSDAMGNPTTMADPTLCSPCADPALGRATGSGIVPDIDTVCDPTTLLCVPANDPPSLRAQKMDCPQMY